MPLSCRDGSTSMPLLRHCQGDGSFAGRQPHRKLARTVLTAAAAGILSALWAAPAVGSLYWDTNGTSVGAVNTAGSPANGIWGTNTTWNQQADGTGSLVSWVSGETAVFSAGTGASGGLATGINTITVNGTQTAAQLTFEEGFTTLTGGTIVLQGIGGAPGVIQNLAPPNNETINSVISGFNGINLVRPGLGGSITLNAANTFFGPL